MLLNLIPLFDQIEHPDNSGDAFRFSAIPVSNFHRLRLGKDRQGAPSLLILSDNPNEMLMIHPVLLEHLYVHPNTECFVSFPNGDRENKKFTIIGCRDTDKTLNYYFLRILAPILSYFTETSSELDLVNAINVLVELFRAISLPPKKTVQGLWAELFLIARSKNPGLLLSSWHVNPEDKYDFSCDDQKIEVKSSIARTRVHHFSLEQLSPPIGTNLIIASLFVERAGSGTTILDLSKRISENIGDDTSLLIKMNSVISTTLGQALKPALEEGFDFQLAEQSLEFYDYSVVPSIKNELPPEISGVHFRSDVNNKQTLDVKKYKTLGKLFQACLTKS